jgi:hypothetical protein
MGPVEKISGITVKPTVLKRQPRPGNEGLTLVLALM